MVRIDHECNIQPKGSMRGNALLAWRFKRKTIKKGLKGLTSVKV